MSVKGKVKWFNSAKGFGFLNCDTETRDIFIHYSSIDMEGYKTLKEGDDVEFEMVEGPKGPQAQGVHLVPSE